MNFLWLTELYLGYEALQTLLACTLAEYMNKIFQQEFHASNYSLY